MTGRLLSFILICASLMFDGGRAPDTQAIPQSPPESRSHAQEITRDRLVAAARAGGDYLIRMQKPDGSFHYYYDPVEDRFSTRSYNILRHAGTALSLFDVYARTRDARYLNAASAGVAFLKTRFRDARGSGAFYVLDNDGKAKLGANGLALLALTRQAELDPKSADLAGAKRLADLIIALQRKDGSFESYYRVRGDEPVARVSLYYPGEAIFGLVRLYELTRERRLIESARRGASFLIASQRKAGALPPDAWLIQALEALYKVDPAASYARHAIAIAHAMMADQYLGTAPPEYRGGFGPGAPASTAAASRAEGMVAAYRLARSTSDPSAERIAGSLRACVRFQLSQQYTAANSLLLPNPGRAAGGFRQSAATARIRIDFVQHNVSSLLGAADVLY
ncbi:MAG TPA: hypothetical protein VJH03_23160 [Blastocatellia bacterium]|nr:hypothetical protein [Blastocatellia bacterium]